MLVQCWPTVYDAGPTLLQYWVDVSRLPGIVCYLQLHTYLVIDSPGGAKTT